MNKNTWNKKAHILGVVIGLSSMMVVFQNFTTKLEPLSEKEKKDDLQVALMAALHSADEQEKASKVALSVTESDRDNAAKKKRSINSVIVDENINVLSVEEPQASKEPDKGL